eukprot:scaffold1394_cov109-Isochrysis_galbana.AAC.31
MHLEEAVAEGARQHLTAPVGAGRVLCGEQHEGRLAVVVEQSVERLEHLALSQVELVQHDPVTMPNRLRQSAVVEGEPAVHVRREGANVLLDIRVLVVVDSYQSVARPLGQPLDHRRLAGRRRALQQDGVSPRRHHPGQVHQPRLDGGRHDEGGVVRHGRAPRVSGEPEAAHFDPVLAGGPGGRHRWRRPEGLAGSGWDQVLEQHGLRLGLESRLQLRDEGHVEPVVQSARQAVAEGQGVRHIRERATQGPKGVFRALVGPIEQPGGGRLGRCLVQRHDGADGRGGQHRAQVLQYHQGQVLCRGEGGYVQLGQPRPDTGRELLLAEVGRRVHRREEAEARVARHHGCLALLGQGDRAALLEQPGHPLESLGRCQVHLVEEQPVALPQRLHERALHEGKGQPVAAA